MLAWGYSEGVKGLLRDECTSLRQRSALSSSCTCSNQDGNNQGREKQTRKCRLHEGSRPQAYKGDSEPRGIAEKSEKARNTTMRNQRGEQGSWYKELGDREEEKNQWTAGNTERQGGEQQA